MIGEIDLVVQEIILYPLLLTLQIPPLPNSPLHSHHQKTHAQVYLQWCPPFKIFRLPFYIYIFLGEVFVAVVIE